MTQTNKFQDSDKQPEWETFSIFRRVSFQYSKTTFLKRKLYLHSLYFSQNMLTLSVPRRVPVICILFLDFACFAITLVWFYDTHLKTTLALRSRKGLTNRWDNSFHYSNDVLVTRTKLELIIVEATDKTISREGIVC